MSFDQFCTLQLGMPPSALRRQLVSFLEEDAGHGDMVLKASPDAFSGKIKAEIVAKSSCVIAGVEFAKEIFRLAGLEDTGGHFTSSMNDGQHAAKGDVVLSFVGQAASMLMAERPSLNLLGRMCGVATYTEDVKSRLSLVQSDHCPELLETRKTTSGLKLFEKYATRVGGARNHRMGLDSGAMLKENHIRSAAKLGVSLKELIQNVQQNLPVLGGLEVEVTCVAECEIALDANAQVIMLDNFSKEMVAEALKLREGKQGSMGARQSLFELSGNLDRVSTNELASSGVDFLSMGALIHQATWSDLSLLFQKENS